MNARTIVVALAALLATSSLTVSALAQPQPGQTQPKAVVKLVLDKTSFEPGAEIHVRVQATDVDLDDSAWIGVLPADIAHGDENVNDEHDLDYRYLRTNHDREDYFTAPAKPGKYDLRLNSSDSSGKELHAVAFEVIPSQRANRDPKPSLRLDAPRYKRGVWMRVEFEAPAQWPADAWVGIIPADVPHGSEATNDAHDVDYRYLQGLTWGVVRMQVPAEPGKYEIRIHDTDNSGKEWKAVPFVVE